MCTNEGFELFFCDLKDEAQKELLAFLGIKDPDEMNLDNIPITILPVAEAWDKEDES